MRYWAIINNVQVGPLEPEQLASYGLTPDTMVWREGWSQWCKAKFVDELTPWITPDTSYGYQGSNNGYWGYGNNCRNTDGQLRPMPSSYLPWALIITFMCCLPAGIVAIIFSSKVESRYAAGDYIGSEKASSTAMAWCIIGVVLGAFKYFVMLLSYLF